MKVLSSFLHFEHTPSLDEKIKDVSLKIAKILNNLGTIKWSCYVKNGEHYSNVNYFSAHNEYHAEACSDNMYESIDLVVSKIEKQVLKRKDRLNKMHRGKNKFEDLGHSI